MADIQNIRLNKVEVKLADTDDPVALKISWDPARSGGANFRTQKIKIDENKIQVVKTAGAIFFGLAFLLPGSGALFIGGPVLFLNEESMAAVVLSIFGFVFAWVGVASLRNYHEITFDRITGAYYRGKAFDSTQVLSRDQQGLLDSIYALQLISERIQSTSSKGHSSNYTSYELNLVFSDGERVNIMDHGAGIKVEESAKALAEFLKVPIWKAVY